MFKESIVEESNDLTQTKLLEEVGEGFDKSFRLLSASDFSYLKKNSESFSSRWTRIYFKKSRINSQNSRIGISVTKKVGKANKRSICKRVIRETFRVSPYKFLGIDMLVIVSPRLFQNSNDPKKDLKSALEYSFKKISKTL